MATIKKTFYNFIKLGEPGQKCITSFCARFWFPQKHLLDEAHNDVDEHINELRDLKVNISLLLIELSRSIGRSLSQIEWEMSSPFPSDSSAARYRISACIGDWKWASR